MKLPTESTRVRPGELWELPLAGTGLLGWAVLKRHPDDPGLVLVVPVDTEQPVGARDLAVPLTWEGTSRPERAVLRGDFGAWLPADDCWFRIPGVELPAAWRREFLELLLAQLEPGSDHAGLARGAPGPLLEALAAEDLAPALAALEAWREREQRAVALDLGAGGASGAGLRLVGDAEDLSGLTSEALPLAAAGPDVLDELLRAGPEDGDGPGMDELVPELVRELPGGIGPGRTLLRLSPDEVQLELTDAAEPPRCLFLGPDGGRVFLRWVRHLHGGWRSQPSSLAELGAPPLRLVVEGERVLDLELDYDLAELEQR